MKKGLAKQFSQGFFSEGKKGFVSIIIPHWNGRELIKQTLLAIKQNTKGVDYEVIVIDNNSTDGSLELLQEMKRKGFVDRLVLNSENKGFAFANNQGFALSKAKYCFMLSNDTVPQKGWLQDAIAIAESNEMIAAVGIQTITPEQFKEKRFKISDEVKEKHTVCGAAMLMRKAVIDLIGNLDAENFSPVYGEETDWNFRARKAGFKVVESERTVIVHVGSPSAKRRGGSKWQYVLMNSHRLRAMLFNLSFFEFTKFIPGLALIFVQSIKDLRLHWLLQSYWNNIAALSLILRERRKRKKAAQHARAIWMKRMQQPKHVFA